MEEVIKYWQLFGERCSGTNYIESLFWKNLAGIELTRDFGGKHWFIKDHHPRCRPNRSTDCQCIRHLSDNSDTLFIVLFRNPFDWLRSINAKPYHAGNHWGLTLSRFLRKPWHAFETSRVNPCWPENEDRYWFIEEAANILRLRTRKIEHLLGLKDRVEHIYFMNYETIQEDNNVLQEIARRFQVALKHTEIQGDKRHFGHRGNVEYVPRNDVRIMQDDLDFIRSELDWELEGRIGYGPEDYRD